jgi:hypothetical protein
LVELSRFGSSLIKGPTGKIYLENELPDDCQDE